ncbi:MAG: hypothetical protein AAFX40_01685 [Cyanobacteria bacterium J06639_1]
MQSTDSTSNRAALLESVAATEEDLALNRQGMLSPKQKAELQKLPSFGEAIFTVFVPLAIGIVVMLPVYFTVTGNPGLFLEALTFSDGDAVMGALVAIFFAVVGVVLIRLAILAIANPLRLRKSAKVERVEGAIAIEVKRFRKSPATFYYLKIQGHSFFVSLKTCQLIREGHLYRVFYEPIQQQILSLEAIGDRAVA